MSTTEIVLNMLAEVSTTEISRAEQPQTFQENQSVAKRGGQVAGAARQSIESQTGKQVITAQNAAQLNEMVVNVIAGVAQDVAEEEE